uniref:Uncharacterized protein n=1 Tax=Anguilla anguilla TaxID=7936 RepID=A0A0E9TJK0_ANGAN
MHSDTPSMSKSPRTVSSHHSYHLTYVTPLEAQSITMCLISLYHRLLNRNLNSISLLTVNCLEMRSLIKMIKLSLL